MGKHYAMESMQHQKDLSDLFCSFDEEKDGTLQFEGLFEEFSDDSAAADDQFDFMSCGDSDDNLAQSHFADGDAPSMNCSDFIEAGDDLSGDLLRFLDQISPTSSVESSLDPVSMCAANSSFAFNPACDVQAAKFSRKQSGFTQPKIKRVRKRKSQRKSVRLFEFIYHYLNEEPSSCVQWVDKTAGIFRLVDNKQVAELWGKYKNNKKMTYESLSRGLRHYYRRGIFERMSQKLHYRFVPRAIELCEKAQLRLYNAPS